MPTDPVAEIEITEISPDLFVRRDPRSKYVIEYHRDACIGAVTCSAIAEHTFGMDDENKATLLYSQEVDSDEIILAAAQSCPVFAIVIKDATTGEQIFPPVIE